MAYQNSDQEPARVRPYLVTTGRTKANAELLPIETLITAASGADFGALRFERRQIAQLCLGRPVSIAELASELDLPLRIVGLLIIDLAADGVVTPAQNSTSDDIELVELLIAGIEAL